MSSWHLPTFLNPELEACHTSWNTVPKMIKHHKIWNTIPNQDPSWKRSRSFCQPWWRVHISSYLVLIAFQLPKTVLNNEQSHVKHWWCTSETLCMGTQYHRESRQCPQLYNNPFQHWQSISVHLRIPQTWTWTSLLFDLHWYLSIHQTPMSYSDNWKKSSDTKCPCTRTVRSPKKIHQIQLIWWYITLSFAMSIIVEIVYSPPARNTRSQKWLYPHGPHNQHLEDGMAILNTRYYFFTLLKPVYCV